MIGRTLFGSARVQSASARSPGAGRATGKESALSTATDNPDDFKLAQAAPMLKLTTRRLRHLIRTFRFPGNKVGHFWYVQREDVARAVLDGLPTTVPTVTSSRIQK